MLFWQPVPGEMIQWKLRFLLRWVLKTLSHLRNWLQKMLLMMQRRSEMFLPWIPIWQWRLTVLTVMRLLMQRWMRLTDWMRCCPQVRKTARLGRLMRIMADSYQKMVRYWWSVLWNFMRVQMVLLMWRFTQWWRPGDLPTAIIRCRMQTHWRQRWNWWILLWLIMTRRLQPSASKRMVSRLISVVLPRVIHPPGLWIFTRRSVWQAAW